MIKYKQYDLIRTPIITEKSTLLSENNKYTFKVLNKVNKLDIKKAIESIFSVKVSKVHIINIQGKVKRFKGILGSRSNYKKAIVTLDKGYSIDLAGVK